MAARLAGKRAFVTGAGQGIGRTIAPAVATEGAEVITASRVLSKMLDLPEAAPAITPVALDEAAFTTGSVLVVDGGQTL